MDRIRIITDTVYLTDEAANQLTTVVGFVRRLTGEGKKRPASLVLSLRIDRYDFLRIVCHRMENGVWRVSCIDANLPAHLRGDNGSPIRTTDELALALTRLLHFVSMVVLPDCQSKIIPGVGKGNRSFIHYLEAMIQIQDPGHQLLIGSHVANMRYQHKPPMITWGESTTFKSRELSLALYDKKSQRKAGILDPAGVESTRIECAIRNAERLAREVKETKAFNGPAGAVVSTMSLESAYAVLRRNIARLSGFGNIVGDLPPGLSKTSKLLLVGLSSQIDEPHVIDLALENYRRAEAPCSRTLRTITQEVREHAARVIAPDALALLPKDFKALRWSDVRMPGSEWLFDALIANMGAPSNSDPEILKAWSSTTFLASKPVGGNIDGPYLPSVALPWKQTL